MAVQRKIIVVKDFSLILSFRKKAISQLRKVFRLAYEFQNLLAHILCFLCILATIL